MKLLSRDFTLREKILLLILSVILIGLCYYQFVDQPVRTQLAQAASEQEALQTELLVVQSKLSELSRMERELENIESDPNVSIMQSYNNSKAEVKMLNDVLKNAVDYSISFEDVTRDGVQIRRQVTLQYVAKDYRTAESILLSIYSSKDRCLISDVNFNAVYNDYRYNTSIWQTGVQVNAILTFYETAVGGTPDAGLPEPVTPPEEAAQAADTDALLE